MSGHSKWSTIKHKKAKTDAQRGKQFSKVVREIMMAAKLGGEDPDCNPRLRLAIQKAKEVNMPNDNVKRAIQKGVGGGESAQLEETAYEAYGPNGVALLIQTLSDNKTRTVSNIKAILTRGGGSMASKGAVSYLFKSKGLIIFEPGSPEDDIMDISLNFGAEDFDTKEDGSIEIISEPENFESLKKAFDESAFSYISASITMIPSSYVAISSNSVDKLLGFIDKLEEDDDVQEVYANFTVES